MRMKMRIAQVAPLTESVPPTGYGGTERIVSYLTDKLVDMGHEVTLFASGDSITKAHLIAPTPVALRHQPEVIDPIAHIFYMLELVQQLKHEFDFIHYHVDYFHFPFSRRNAVAQCTTMHGRLDIPDLKVLFKEFREMPLISISNSQRKPLPYSNFMKTIYHGLPPQLFRFNENPGKYLAFVGRISPEKRLDRAIEIATRTGIPLKVAAKIDKVDVEYYEQKIRPLMDHPLVEFIGEINDREKSDFFGNACAVLFPIDWPEPFGLVMIEAMACGTPVIAFNCGSVPEVIDEEKTGYVVNSIEEAVEKVKNIQSLDRRLCRKIFEERFTDLRMANDYLMVYKQLVEEINFKKPMMI
jgi:glycosyltransferase involved in cell wall biosynthesis